VTGTLRGDPHPVRAGKPHRMHHVGSRLGHHNGSGPLVHGQVPRLPRLVVAVLARHEYLAGDRGP